MKCPKCGKELKAGHIAGLWHGYPANYFTKTFWAETSYFWKAVFPNAKDAVENGGMKITLSAGTEVTDAVPGLACTECGLVVLDCNQQKKPQ